MAVICEWRESGIYERRRQRGVLVFHHGRVKLWRRPRRDGRGDAEFDAQCERTSRNRRAGHTERGRRKLCESPLSRGGRGQVAACARLLQQLSASKRGNGHERYCCQPYVCRIAHGHPCRHGRGGRQFRRTVHGTPHGQLGGDLRRRRGGDGKRRGLQRLGVGELGLQRQVRVRRHADRPVSTAGAGGRWHV